MYGNKVAPLYSLAEEGKKMRKSMKNIKYCWLWQKEGIVLLSPVILRLKPLSLISDVICHMESCISTTTVESSDTTQSSPVSASSKNETLDETTAHSKTPAIHTAENELDEELTTRSQVHTERGTGTRGQQFAHTFSQPVIIVIIFGVMAGIIGTILLVSYGIGRLQKKSLPQEQPPFSNDEGPPLSSVETGNPEM